MSGVLAFNNDKGAESYQRLRRETLEMYSAGGMPKGDSTGWSTLDPFYTVGQGQWTVVTGVPGSGKSEFVDAMAVNLAESGEWDFAIYSPENYPTRGHVVKLVEKRVRKPFGMGPTERMTKAELEDGMFWLFERFFWISPELAEPEELLQMASQRRRPDKKLGVILDPWNTLEHQRGGLSETDYVSKVLTKVTRIARETNAHIWLVVHPAKLNRDRDGKRPIPTPYDISGSAHWFNKADNIICVHRDKAQQTQDVQILVQKVRFKHLGAIGDVTLKWDKVTGRYFEWGGHTITDPVTGKPELYADPEARYGR